MNPDEIKSLKWYNFPLFKKILKGLVLVVILLVIITLAFLNKDLLREAPINNNVYSAVFLTNGQVYFGKIIKNNEKEIILNDVYYLQVDEPDQTQLNLIKLGQEIHGPTDEMFINKTHIIFHEYLRDDSQVVESIRNYKE